MENKDEAFKSLLEGTISALQAVLGELNALNGGEPGDSQTADVGETRTAEATATEKDAPPWEGTSDSSTATISRDDVKALCSSRAAKDGKRDAVIKLLHKYGAGNLSSVPKENYAALYAELLKLGNAAEGKR